MEAVVAKLIEHFTLPVAWPAALLLALAVVVIAEVIYRVLFRVLTRLAGLTQTTLDDVLLRRLRLPARVLVVLVGFHALLALRQIENAGVAEGLAITELLLVAYLVIETAETLFLHYLLGERHGVQVPSIVRHLILIIVYTVAVLSIVGGVTGINVAPLLATSTVVTVVVGLALQDTLGNLFAGLAMSMDRPFKLGDWVLVDSIEGCVVYSGWRATHLQTFTRDIVVIPNSMLSKSRLQNFYRPTTICGRNQEIIVALHAMPEEVEQACLLAITKVPAILRTPTHKVWFVQTTPLFHRYVIRIYIDDFGVHDDVESDFMKALTHELAARHINVGNQVAVAGMDFEGRTVAMATALPADRLRTDPGESPAKP
jgi:small-conductance mechanosensitive channel